MDVAISGASGLIGSALSASLRADGHRVLRLVRGGVGYSRHMPFEHIYRHHRRYRITEGSEEIQMRKVGQQLFGIGRS